MSFDQAPIGSITAFGGLMSANMASMHASGWLPCDGGSYSRAAGSTYQALFNVIGTAFGGDSSNFNVPDLRGRFLRGASRGVSPARDPDVATRTAPLPGGATGDAVGSVQGWATGLPTTPFRAAESGRHTHQVPHVPTSSNQTAVAGPTGHDICANNDDTSTSDSQGGHTHTLSTGGDDETRPNNLNLHWFIKFQNTAS